LHIENQKKNTQKKPIKSPYQIEIQPTQKRFHILSVLHFTSYIDHELCNATILYSSELLSDVITFVQCGITLEKKIKQNLHLAPAII